MGYVMREGDIYETPLGVLGSRPVGFCPCCGEYSLFTAEGGFWCLVCSSIKPSFSLSGEELEFYRSRLLSLRNDENGVKEVINNDL